MQLKFETNDLYKSFTNLQNTVIKASLKKADNIADILEQSAKSNAPWNDNTGKARNSISSEAVLLNNSIDIIIWGNTSYFPFLELANEGKNAVLWPTVLEQSHQCINSFAHLI